MVATGSYTRLGCNTKRRLSLSFEIMSILSVAVITISLLMSSDNGHYSLRQVYCDVNIDFANNNHSKSTQINQAIIREMKISDRERRSSTLFNSIITDQDNEQHDSMGIQWLVRERQVQRKTASDDHPIVNNQQSSPTITSASLGKTNWQDSFHQPRRGESGQQQQQQQQTKMAQLESRQAPTTTKTARTGAKSGRQATDSSQVGELQPIGSWAQLTAAAPRFQLEGTRSDGKKLHQRKREKLTSTRGSSSEPETNNANHLYFDLANTQRKVQAHLGETAYLLCRLKSSFQHQAGGGSLIVSWIRNEHEILTSADFRQTSDERFKPSHMLASPDWVLEINNVAANDQGTYECQLNSEPKAAKLTIQLETLHSQLEISANFSEQPYSGEQSAAIELDERSDLQLTCRLTFQRTPPGGDKSHDKTMIDAQPVAEKLTKTSTTASPFKLQPNYATVADHFREAEGDSGQLASDEEEAAEDDGADLSGSKMQHFIYWYRDEVDLQFANQLRKGIQFERKRIWNNKVKLLESQLTIPNVNKADSGLYSCKVVPSLQGVLPAQKRVFISKLHQDSRGSFFQWTSNAMTNLPLDHKFAFTNLILSLISLRCLEMIII